MATTYEAATEEVKSMVRTIMGKWHADLVKEDVRVGCIMAYNGESAAVKHGGYPAAATMKVVSLKDRVEKKYEAELLIDQTWWNEAQKKHREALIDHELSHLELVPDEEEGGFKRDDLGRPKLKIKLGDWNAGDGFKVVVERHGDYANEVVQLKKVNALVAEAKITLFPPEKEAS